jgi:hypothetical protein
MQNRRDFLLMRPLAERPFELSCERLYMRYLDSIDELNTGELAESLERDLRELKTVRVTGTGWLTREDFRSWLDPILVDLQRQGVRIVFDPPRPEA